MLDTPVLASIVDPFTEILNAGTNHKMTTNRQIVWVQWADAHMSESGWLDLTDYSDDGETIVDSVGFLIPVGEPGSKDQHVTLWQSLCKGEGIHAMHIPVQMVRSIKVLVD
jgi:hypothetical protein